MGKARFTRGDLVALHFTDPSSIGYNGCLYKIVSVFGEKYICESVFGTGVVWAKAEELIPQTSSVSSQLLKTGVQE